MGHPARAETLKSARELRNSAGPGGGLRVAAGEYVQIVDLEGRGGADFFALAASNSTEYLSASHTRVQIDRLFPQMSQSACPQQWNPATNDLLARRLTR